MANADYNKVYFIPELETKLQYCLNNFRSTDPNVRETVAKDLNLVKTEVTKELEDTRQSVLAAANLELGKFDSLTYNEVTAYLENLKKFYVKRYNAADQEKEKRIFKLTETPEKEALYNKFRETYHNEAITELVKNLTETHRIIEKDGRLIQKIYPVYKDPDPAHAIDFDAQFYMPAKHFLREDIDTFYFNTGVIWSMTLALALALYFDVLRRIIDGFGNLSNPMNRRK
jgi:hypothetical protein